MKRLSIAAMLEPAARRDEAIGAMKLFHSFASPFVRKVLVSAHELGVAGAIEVVTVGTTPVSPDASLATSNPLAKLPTLVLDDGSTLFDSPVICEYLDTTHGARRLVPAAGPERWRVRRTEALADGVLDAAVLIRYETHLRPEPLRWADWIDQQSEKVRRSLDLLEGEVDTWGAELDLGQIAVACALGYLDFRQPVSGHRDGRPRLLAWYERFRQRASMQATEPR